MSILISHKNAPTRFILDHPSPLNNNIGNDVSFYSSSSKYYLFTCSTIKLINMTNGLIVLGLVNRASIQLNILTKHIPYESSWTWLSTFCGDHSCLGKEFARHVDIQMYF
ncbi:unnamed protein product [Rotaria magnacalcarata]